MTRICVTGEALVDYVPDNEGVLQWTPGGSGLNTVVALARLGLDTSFSASLSQDTDGHRLSAFMRDENIDLTHAHISPKSCPHVIVSNDARGVPAYDLHLAGSALEDAPACWSWDADTQHFHATSFAATLGPCGDASVAALHATRGHMTSSFDPNLRASVFPNRSVVPLLLAQRIRHADIVKVSSEDLDVLAPGILHDHLIGEWRALGPKLLIVTRGAKGAIAFFENSYVEVAACCVVVCDTIGAGDTFMGAFLAIMAQDKCLGALPQAFAPDQVARWLAFASKAASLCCMRAGANPPRLVEMSAS